MKKTALALSLAATLFATHVYADDDKGAAFAILGSSPFAHQTYGPNVVRGEAKLAPHGRGLTQVTVRINGLKPGTTHVGHIHGGTCAQLFAGAILHNLEPIVVNAQGRGMSKTEIPATLENLRDCDWWVAVHEGAANSSPQTPAVAIGPVLTRGETR